MEITQIEHDKAWQCPFCGYWFTDGETICEECNYLMASGVLFTTHPLVSADANTGKIQCKHRRTSAT